MDGGMAVSNQQILNALLGTLAVCGANPRRSVGIKLMRKTQGCIADVSSAACFVALVKADDDAMTCPTHQIWVQAVLVTIVLWRAIPDARNSNGRDAT